jgi:hypothetical protein
MKIQFKHYKDGDIEDPKTGEPMAATPESLIGLLRGRVVSGVGGVDPASEMFVINFSDGTALWFATTQGIPRILYQKYEL